MPYWTSVMIPKFKRIMMKYDIDDYKTLYRKLFEKFGEQYPNKDLNQMIDDYCHNNNLKNCMTMDALAYDKEYRSLFEEMSEQFDKTIILLENELSKVATVVS